MPSLRAFVPLLALLVFAGSTVAAPRGLDDLMMDLQIAPLEPKTPPPFSVTTISGAPITLEDVKGHAALIYFWATW